MYMNISECMYHNTYQGAPAPKEAATGGAA